MGMAGSASSSCRVSSHIYSLDIPDISYTPLQELRLLTHPPPSGNIHLLTRSRVMLGSGRWEDDREDGHSMCFALCDAPSPYKLAIS